MVVISIILIVMFLILFSWLWHSLGSIENKTKLVIIVVGLLLTYLITLIIVSVSKSGLVYSKTDTELKSLQIVLTLLFTIVNGYILLPFICRKIEKIDSNEIDKDSLIKSLIILLIIFVFIAIFESNYLKGIQKSFVGLEQKMVNNIK